MSRMAAAKGLAERSVLHLRSHRAGLHGMSSMLRIAGPMAVSGDHEQGTSLSDTTRGGPIALNSAAQWRTQALQPAAARPAMHPFLAWHRAKSSASPDMRSEDNTEGDSAAMAAAAAAAVSSHTASVSMNCSAAEDLMDQTLLKTKTNNDTTDAVQGLDGVGLSGRMRDKLTKCGITDLFPVQRATFEALMNGKDVLVKARTGSGKTIGFALPIIEKIMAARDGQKEERGRAPQSVILAPTRELAMQIQREFVRIDRSVLALCIYGGAPSGPQERGLREGVDVVVGTPGRVIDMLERGALRMEEVKVFVLDEADEMLKMGFQEDVEKIMEGLPAERQMNLWSATQPRWITTMAKRYCKNLQTMDMVGNNPVRTAETIRHIAAATPWQHKATVVSNMVRAHASGKRALVFCNTKMDVDEMAASPNLSSIARVIHGDVAQMQREKTLADFRAGLFTVLVATDVAARGIDIPEVALVIQTKVVCVCARAYFVFLYRHCIHFSHQPLTLRPRV